MLRYKKWMDSKMETVYTKELLEKIGNVYKRLLYVLNDNSKDPYGQLVAIRPFYYLTLVILRATPLGIPKGLSKDIADLMDMISPDDVDYLMETPVPMEMRQYFVTAYMGYKK